MKFTVSILICVLSFCVACSELTELVTLQDDVSNDFTMQVTSGLDKIARCIACATTFSVRRQVRQGMDRYSSAASILVLPVPSAANDLLHLLSIQRT